MAGPLGKHGFVGRIVRLANAVFSTTFERPAASAPGKSPRAAASRSRCRLPARLTVSSAGSAAMAAPDFDRSGNGSPNRLVGHQRAGGVVNHDDVGTIGARGERLRDGVLAASAAGDDLGGLPPDEQRRRAVPRRSSGGQCHHHVIDHVAVAERVDTTLENRSSAQRQELLGLRSAEARPRPPAAMMADTCKGVGSGSLILVVPRRCYWERPK